MNVSIPAPSGGRSADVLQLRGAQPPVVKNVPSERDELSDPPAELEIDIAKAALEQVQKRLEAQLSVKASTEGRALILAGQCMPVLIAVTAAGIAEAARQQPHWFLVLAAVGGGLPLFAAVWTAYWSARPGSGTLPGRLPVDLWEDMTAAQMKGPEFIARLVWSLHQGMLDNEDEQTLRATRLSRALTLAFLAPVSAVVIALIAAKWSWIVPHVVMLWSQVAMLQSRI